MGWSGQVRSGARFDRAALTHESGFAGISGLFAGVLIIMRRHRASGGAILPLALLWIATAVITGIWGTPGAEGESVAWVAHIGGFLAGLALFPFAMPRR